MDHQDSGASRVFNIDDRSEESDRQGNAFSLTDVHEPRCLLNIKFNQASQAGHHHHTPYLVFSVSMFVELVKLVVSLAQLAWQKQSEVPVI